MTSSDGIPVWVTPSGENERWKPILDCYLRDTLGYDLGEHSETYFRRGYFYSSGNSQCKKKLEHEELRLEKKFQ